MENKQLTATGFLGTGWAFPPAFHHAQQQVLMVSAEEDIRQSLEILLGTQLGERFLQPGFGCNLEGYLFESLNATVETSIRITVMQALRMYEPRITVEAVQLDTALLTEGRLDIVVTYTIISTNTRHNYVYPFYTKEANSIT